MNDDLAFHVHHLRPHYGGVSQVEEQRDLFPRSKDFFLCDWERFIGQCLYIKLFEFWGPQDGIFFFSWNFFLYLPSLPGHSGSQLPTFCPQVPRGLLSSPQATADTVPHHPKHPTLRGWPGPSLQTAPRSSASCSSMRTWLLPGSPARAPPAPTPPFLAPLPSLWTAVLCLGQLSGLSLNLGVIASIGPSW